MCHKDRKVLSFFSSKISFFSVISVSLWLIFFSLSAFAQDGDDFVFAQLRYDGGNWNPHPKAYEEILYYLISTTNVRCEIKREVVRADDPVLFQRPFLYLAGNGDFKPFSQREVQSLRRYLSGGGFLLVDDCSKSLDNSFYEAVKRELARILPDKELISLDEEHAIFYSFYLRLLHLPDKFLTNIRSQFPRVLGYLVCPCPVGLQFALFRFGHCHSVRTPSQ